MITEGQIKDDFILKAIESGIKLEAEKLIEEATERVVKTLEEKTPEIIAGIIVNVMGMTDMKVMEDRIVFTIIKKDK